MGESTSATMAEASGGLQLATAFSSCVASSAGSRPRWAERSLVSSSSSASTRGCVSFARCR